MKVFKELYLYTIDGYVSRYVQGEYESDGHKLIITSSKPSVIKELFDDGHLIDTITFKNEDENEKFEIKQPKARLYKNKVYFEIR